MEFLQTDSRAQLQLAQFVGNTPQAVQVRAVVQKCARTNCTILIHGETGTGKEIVARAIHHNSSRHAHRFIAFSCSAVNENLMDSELFGHERGAFTGAEKQRIGRFELAERGTFFLDEVGTMSVALQMKLLRVLQEREFERVGDSHTIKVDVRMIAATNSNLAKMVVQGQFREDLFYRLNIFPLELPPLRERRDDIPLLVSHFLNKFSHDEADPVTRTVSPKAMSELIDFRWPGNVRQLENTVRGGNVRALIDGSRTINLDHLKPYMIQMVAPPGNGNGSEPTANDVLREYYRGLLVKYEWQPHKGS